MFLLLLTLHFLTILIKIEHYGLLLIRPIFYLMDKRGVFMSSTQNRRQFDRVLYSATATIAQERKQWNTIIEDLSIHGVLTSCPNDWKETDSDEYIIQFVLPDVHDQIRIDAILVAYDSTHLRFQIKEIDIDSLTDLRRIVELNSGENDLMTRNIEELVARIK